jgi:hypothetical protein
MDVRSRLLRMLAVLAVAPPVSGNWIGRAGALPRAWRATLGRWSLDPVDRRSSDRVGRL